MSPYDQVEQETNLSLSGWNCTFKNRRNTQYEIETSQAQLKSFILHLDQDNTEGGILPSMPIKKVIFIFRIFLKEFREYN